MSALKKIASPVLGIAGGALGSMVGMPGLGASLGGALGGAIAGHDSAQGLAAGATSAGQQGAAAAQYHPVNSYNPYGSITNGPNGMTTTLNPQMQAQQRMFTNMAGNAAGYAGQAGQQMQGAGQMFNNLGQQYAQGAAGAGANFTNAGNRMLGAMGNFNPQQYANQAYGNMAAMAAPGNTDQTQNMMNYEQASGRNGLNQNGQLGDMGGLALAQKTADNQMRMQAMQMGQAQQQLMGNQATQFAGMGANQTNNYAGIGNMFAGTGLNQQNSAVDRYGALNTIAGNNQGYANSIGQQMVPYGQMANTQAQNMAQAGGNAGQMLYDSQMARNNVNGSYQGGLNGALGSPDVQNAITGLGTKVGGWLSDKFSGMGTPAPGSGPTMPSFNLGTSLGQAGNPYGSWNPYGN